MGKIFYLMGKSASGKDKIYNALLADPGLSFLPVVLYTTRPVREKEKDGETYHFTDEEGLARLAAAGKVIEQRDYSTAAGIWSYATVDDGTFDSPDGDFLAIGTIASYLKMKAYFGEDRIVPILIETEDGARLLRAVIREQKQARPNYREVCRRFLADCEDFSEERIAEAGITARFANDGTLADCIGRVAAYCKTMRGMV